MSGDLVIGTGSSFVIPTSDSGTATSLNVPSNTLSDAVVGDMIVVWAHQQGTATVALTAPTGWTRVGALPGSPSGSAARESQVWYYPLKTEDDVDAVNLSMTFGFGTVTAGRAVLLGGRVTGIDLDDPVDAEATAYGTASAATSATSATLTTTNPTTMLMSFCFSENGVSATPHSFSGLSGTTETLDGYTTALTTISSTHAAMGYTNLVSAGTTTATVASYSLARSLISVQQVAFKVGPWSPSDENAGVEVQYTSDVDTLSTGALYYTSDTDTLSTPLEVRPVPVGYASVTEMLADSPNIRIAHRGGSLSWPEMSMHAYTQSVFWGMKALEISVERTLDGVFFGLHDATLDRTSGVTNIDPSTLTWSQIQSTYSISANLPGGQTAKPYMAVQDLFDAYAKTHVIFVDPKSLSAGDRSDLLDLMDAQVGFTPTDKFVWKSFGVGNTIRSAGAARGYKTWGYFYQADSASFATYAPNYDILGMDYNADGTTWTAIKSYGKPVLAHIIPNSTAATTALSFSPDGLMVSGVKQAVTRSP